MSTTTAKSNKPTARDLDAKAIQGTDKYLASAVSITLLGKSFTSADLKAVFQADIDATQAADAGHTQWKQHVATQKATQVATRAVRKALKNYLLGAYGPDAVGVLEDFGFSPPKSPGRKTVAAKTQGLVKAAATRVARHTMGKTQKKGIKGAVTGVLITPVVAAPPVVTAPSSPTAHATSTGPTDGATPHAS